MSEPAPRRRASETPVPGPDGLPRCPWCLDAPEYLGYHDLEWGRPVHDDNALFEHLCLEAFQSGLSWLTILRKRENFRAAFGAFDIETVASFGQQDVARLLADTGIVRNRAKIDAAIGNARAAAALPVSLDELIWKFAPDDVQVPVRMSDVPSSSPESKALSKELRRHGFSFTGPVTAYATMQSCGIVNDHLAACVSRDAGRLASS
jgi:DNA-3-methyladenine glycosylase I